MKLAIAIGRHTLRMRHFLVAVGVLCGIGILAGTLVLLRHDRQNELRTEDARGRLLASMLESHVSRTLSSVDNNFTAISKMLMLPAQRHGGDPGGVDVRALLDTITSSSTHLRSVSVLDAGGRVVSSSNRDNIGRRFSLQQLGFRNEIAAGLTSGRPLFIRDLHELDDSIDAGIDAGMEGRFQERGVYVIPFATLVRVGDANLTLLALVNPAYLFPDHRSGPRSDAGYEALFDYQGVVLAATPDAPFVIGSRNARLPMFDALNNDQQFGRFDLTRRSAEDTDDNTLVNFRTSRNFSVVAVVGLSEQHALAAWEQSAYKLRLIGIFAAALALLYTAALNKTILDGERTREELRKAKETAEQANAAKSVFLSTMSHEIRTPMNGVLGMAALLRETRLSSQQDEFARTIEDSGRALMAIINDVLDFSKIEAGKMDIDLVDCPLLPLAEGCIDALVGRAAGRGLALISFVDPALPAVVRADGGRIRQILLNLIDNAVKFTQSGEIVLRVSLRERAVNSCRVLFEVSDTGIGIEEQAISRLFQPFIQADNSVTRKYGGTGLGLSICKRLLGLMGSRIDVESRPGEGTTFRFELHLSEVARPLAVAPLPAVMALVVCALEGHAGALVSYLAAWGMQAQCAATPEQALALAASAPHALAVIDGRMPLSATTAAALAKSHPGMRLVLLAGDTAAPQEQPAFHATLHRPLRQAALHQALVFALEHRHYLQQPSPASRPPGSATEASSAGEDAERRILLVEDNLTNQKVALHQLTRLGYIAHVASNGQEALNAMAMHDYALVLMDCQMPLLDGFEATRRIRAAEAGKGSRQIVVAMTANAAEGDRERCLAAGMDDYLPKPITREMLAELLRRWLPPLPEPEGPQPAGVRHAASPQ